MGNPKQKWTSEEEDALRAGVAKHGTGKWKNIQRDPEFNPYLFSRSNIDLKDKWRNMSVSSGGQGPREKSRIPKPKDATAVPVSTPQTPAATPAATPTATPVAHDTSAADVAMDDSSKNLAPKYTSADVVMDDSSKNLAPKYTAMIFEAIAALKEPNGSDSSAIFGYIEQRHEVPQNFKRLLSSRLRRLCLQEKLDKIQNCYKLKPDAVLGTRTPTPKQKDIRLKQLQSTGYMTAGETVEEAAVAAAYKVAEAENKSFVAAEAVKEAERVSKMAEETDSLLQLAMEVFEKCSRGEIVLMA